MTRVEAGYRPQKGQAVVFVKGDLIGDTGVLLGIDDYDDKAFVKLDETRDIKLVNVSVLTKR